MQTIIIATTDIYDGDGMRESVIKLLKSRDSNADEWGYFITTDSGSRRYRNYEKALNAYAKSVCTACR